MPELGIGSGRIHYREAGRGPLAVFIHGYPLDHRVWLDQLSGLAAIRHCVAPDLRGHGRSDAWAAGPLTMEALAGDVVELIAALGEARADVVGLSMGGYVALALWETAPAMVRSLALIDTRAGADGPEARAGRDSAAERVVSGGRAALAEELVAALLAPGAPVAVRARLRTMVEDTPYETALGVLAGMRDRKDRTDLLAGITVPTLVVSGAEDRLIPPSQAEALAGAVPGSRLEVLADAGHLPPLEVPGALNRLLTEFWEGSR